MLMDIERRRDVSDQAHPLSSRRAGTYASDQQGRLSPARSYAQRHQAKLLTAQSANGMSPRAQSPFSLVKGQQHRDTMPAHGQHDQGSCISMAESFGHRAADTAMLSATNEVQDSTGSNSTVRGFDIPKLNLSKVLSPSHLPDTYSQDTQPSLQLATSHKGMATSATHNSSMPPPKSSRLSLTSQHKQPGSLTHSTTLTGGSSGSSAGGIASMSLGVSSGPEGWRRLSTDGAPPSAAALERREQLRQYQAQKAAAAAAKGSKPAGQQPMNHHDGGLTARTSARRVSVGSSVMKPPAARPPLPSAQHLRTAAAAVPHAASKPLPPDSDCDEAWHPPHHNHQHDHNTSSSSPVPTRPHEPFSHYNSHSLLETPQASSINGLSATHINHSILTAATPAMRQPLSGRPSLPLDNSNVPPLQGRLSLGSSLGGGQLSARGHPFLTPRASLGSAAVAGVSQTGNNTTDMRQEIRGLKLQELQWRLLNARMQHSMTVRKQKGEIALMSCLVATRQLEHSNCVAAANMVRAEQQERARIAATAMAPLLNQFASLQAQPDSPAAMLQQISTALLNSLTSVPLMQGAVCAALEAQLQQDDIGVCYTSDSSSCWQHRSHQAHQTEADLQALQQVMNRGVHALMLIDAALKPLITACERDNRGGQAVSAASSSKLAAAQAVGNGSATSSHTSSLSSSSSSSQQSLQLPTAMILHDLVAVVKDEVGMLSEAMQLLDKLKSQQLMLSSCQIQLIQMGRRAAASEMN